MASPTDKEILDLIRSKTGREKGLRLLIETHKHRIYWHIRRLVVNHDDTDDILQEVFIKAWNNIARFREESNLYTWLYRIASNEALAFLRKKQRMNSVPIDEYLPSLSGAEMNDAFFTRDDNLRRFQQALLELPDKQRLVFNLKYFDDLKYEEISAITGISVGGLKASYHHAVKKIEKNLEEVKPLTLNNIKTSE